jgi:hypothetical protein
MIIIHTFFLYSLGIISTLNRFSYWLELVKFDGFLSPLSSHEFSLSLTSHSLFNFNWSSYTCFRNRGIRVMVLSSSTIVYLFLNLLWIALLSNYHGRHKSKWLACIGTTSHITSSEYLPIAKEISTCLLAFTSPHSFNHCNL